jgi:hypothetical protein
MRTKRNAVTLLVTTTAAVLLTAGCGGGNTADTSTPDTVTSSGAPSTTPQTPEPSQSQGAPLNTFGDGNYLVPKDVTPGTYHTAGAARDGVDCYWQRDGADGNPNANHASRDAQTVTIVPTDTAFHTVGCKPWSRSS